MGIKKLGGHGKRRSPRGKFISEYSYYNLNKEFVIDSEFQGIYNIRQVKKLRERARIKMSRNAWMNHSHKKNHIANKDEIMEVINDPDLVLLQEKKFGSNVVQFIIKDIQSERPRIIVLYTDNDNEHKIATGYYIDRKKLKNYLQKHKIVYSR